MHEALDLESRMSTRLYRFMRWAAPSAAVLGLVFLLGAGALMLWRPPSVPSTCGRQLAEAGFGLVGAALAAWVVLARERGKPGN